jgi:hypothetical protein
MSRGRSSPLRPAKDKQRSAWDYENLWARPNLTAQEVFAVSNDFAPSAEFVEFFSLAIEHAFGSIADRGGPLIPFAMTVSIDGQQRLTRFLAERLEEGLERAIQHVDVHQHDLAMYAIAWDGYVTLEGERADAVLVEAGERKDRRSVIFCQRYREVRAGLLRRKRRRSIGEPAMVDRPETRFKTVGT